MVMSSSYSNTTPLGSLLEIKLYSRKLLLQEYFYRRPATATSSLITAPGTSTADPSAPPEGSGFDANVVMILAVLLCALICALGLNSIVRCALRCSSRMGTEPTEPANSVVLLGRTGLRRKAIRSLPTVVYSAGVRFTGTAPECNICLLEFAPGERVRVMPKCSHGFHVKCIDRWLMAQSSCPTCRRCLFGSCEKLSGCAARAIGLGQEPPVRTGPVPLDREGLFRGLSTLEA